MGIRFACHHCAKQLNIKQELAGKRGRCPACGTRFRIPKSDQDLSLPLEEPAGGYDAETDPETDPNVPITESENPNQPAHVVTTGEKSPAETPFDLLSDGASRWYVRPPNGGRYGPADGNTIRQWVSEGRITPSTLLWRDGWAQWREFAEVLPEAFTPSEPVTPSSSAPIALPGNATAKLALTKPALTATNRESDVYLGARKKQKAKQRATLIAVLVALSLLLVIALVVAMLWPTGEAG